MIKLTLIAPLLFVSLFIGNRTHAQSSYFNSFKTNNATGIVLEGDAKLTSGTNDPVNDGYLRLTSNQQNKSGFAYIDTSFPSALGIKVEFEYYTWGGNIADGITFFLFNPVNGFAIGQYGGALGYAQNNNNGTGLGLKNGFLAVGLDEYGNFGAATETKNGGFKNINGQVYTTPIIANGLVTVRGGVGPNGEREGLSAYPFLGGKITSKVFGGTVEPSATDILADADLFNIATGDRGPNETDANFRKVRLDIRRIVGTGYVINLEVFVGSKGRWIKVLEDFVYSIADSRVPSTLKAGFSASTGFQYDNHEIRNVLITPSAALLAKPIAKPDAKTTVANQPINISVLENDDPTVNSGTFQSGTLDLDPATIVIETTKVIAGKGTFTVNNAGLVTLTPLPGFTGTVAVDYNFKDTYGMISDNATLTVTVTIGSSKPTVNPIDKTGTEDTPVTFTATDFTLKFIDPETDPLMKIKFTSLPAANDGVLKLNGTNITINQEILSAQLGNITFVPAANRNGGIPPFNWNGSDHTNYAITDKPVTITITSVNDAPTVNPIDKTGTEDTPVTFTATDFTLKFVDPETDPLMKIKFTSLPAANDGVLKLSGTNITINQEIPSAQLGNITFVPAVNRNGSIPPFNWNGSDHTNYAITDKPVTITITSVNDAPIAVNDLSQTEINKPIEITILNNDLTDGLNIDKASVILVSNPLHGDIKVSSTGVVTYKPHDQYIGSDSFTYKVKDSNGIWSNIAIVSIEVEGIIMSNVFTPNGDGKNDTFVIAGLEKYDFADLTIFNRWGNEVYRNSKYTNTWDGFGLNAATYFFIIKLKKGNTEDIRKGWVLLKRY